MAVKMAFDRIEIVKKQAKVPEGLPIERTIHNPDRVDIGKYMSRLHGGRIIEIEETQEYSPVYDGMNIVVDYVPTGYRKISFLIIEDQ